jgi:cytochrome c-type biogenesis protein CcmH/NrfF
MRRELRAALQKGDNDDVILQSFVQKYGASVLVVPRMRDINKFAWIMGSALLVVIASVVIVLLRKRQSHPAMETAPLSKVQGIDADALRQVREQTENDD